MDETKQDPKPKAEAPVEIILHRIYSKGSLFESSNYSLSFIEPPPKPNIEQQMAANAYPKEGDLQEAVLTLHLTAKHEGNLLWRLQLQQAGLYTMEGFPEAEQKAILNGFCINQLYPYACAAVNHLVTHGGFPPIYLAPVNFEQLYQQQLKQQKTKQPLTEAVN